MAVLHALQWARPYSGRRPLVPLAAVVLLWFALVPGLGAGVPRQVADAGSDAGSGAPQNIVLVVVDTLRADRLHTLIAHGRLPYFADLARRSVRFTDVRASSSWTPTATASIFTSLHPFQHGVLRGRLVATSGSSKVAADAGRLTPFHRLPEALTTLPMAMRAAGYATLGLSDNVHVDGAAGFARGFERFSQFADRGARHLARRMLAARRSVGVSPEGQVGQERQPGRRTFTYLHFMDPHAPYRRHARFFVAPRGAQVDVPFARERARYDSEIALVDAALAELHARLAWDRDTLLVVTSDHGEGFGDHGHLGHPNQLFDELLHVPMLWFWPDRFEAAVVTEPVATIDILPTLRSLIRSQASRRDAGKDLAPWLMGRPEVPATRLLYAARQGQVNPAQLRQSLTDGRTKLIWSSAPVRGQRFDLVADPGEQRPTRLSSSAPRSPLRRAWDHTAQALPRFAPTLVDAEADQGDLMKKLRALGYAH